MEFGDGSVYNDFDRHHDSLIPMKDIINLDTEIEESQDLEYDPLQAITKEDEQSLLKAAVELEPHHHEINHQLQIVQGPTSSASYLKSVMLMIASNLRVLHLNPFQEMHLQLLADTKSPEPNAALDAWILLNGRRRAEFDASLLLASYPGMKRHINWNEDEIDGDEKDDEDGLAYDEDEKSDDSDEDDMNDGGKSVEKHHDVDDEDDDMNDEESATTAYQTTTPTRPWLVKFTSWLKK